MAPSQSSYAETPTQSDYSRPVDANRGLDIYGPPPFRDQVAPVSLSALAMNSQSYQANAGPSSGRESQQESKGNHRAAWQWPLMTSTNIALAQSTGQPEPEEGVFPFSEDEQEEEVEEEEEGDNRGAGGQYDHAQIYTHVNIQEHASATLVGPGQYQFGNEADTYHETQQDMFNDIAETFEEYQRRFQGQEFHDMLLQTLAEVEQQVIDVDRETVVVDPLENVYGSLSTALEQLFGYLPTLDSYFLLCHLAAARVNLPTHKQELLRVLHDKTSHMIQLAIEVEDVLEDYVAVAIAASDGQPGYVDIPKPVFLGLCWRLFIAWARWCVALFEARGLYEFSVFSKYHLHILCKRMQQLVYWLQIAGPADPIFRDFYPNLMNGPARDIREALLQYGLTMGDSSAI